MNIQIAGRNGSLMRFILTFLCLIYRVGAFLFEADITEDHRLRLNVVELRICICSPQCSSARVNRNTKRKPPIIKVDPSLEEVRIQWMFCATKRNYL